MDKLVCDECREKSPHIMSCIHTFLPRVRESLLGRDTRDEDRRAARELAEFSQHGA